MKYCFERLKKNLLKFTQEHKGFEGAYHFYPYPPYNEVLKETIWDGHLYFSSHDNRVLKTCDSISFYAILETKFKNRYRPLWVCNMLTHPILSRTLSAHGLIDEKDFNDAKEDIRKDEAILVNRVIKEVISNINSDERCVPVRCKTLSEIYNGLSPIDMGATPYKHGYPQKGNEILTIEEQIKLIKKKVIN